MEVRLILVGAGWALEVVVVVCWGSSDLAVDWEGCWLGVRVFPIWLVRFVLLFVVDGEGTSLGKLNVYVIDQGFSE